MGHPVRTLMAGEREADSSAALRNDQKKLQGRGGNVREVFRDEQHGRSFPFTAFRVRMTISVGLEKADTQIPFGNDKVGV
jgi:hypothetical protein